MAHFRQFWVKESLSQPRHSETISFTPKLLGTSIVGWVENRPNFNILFLRNIFFVIPGLYLRHGDCSSCRTFLSLFFLFCPPKSFFGREIELLKRGAQKAKKSSVSEEPEHEREILRRGAQKRKIAPEGEEPKNEKEILQRGAQRTKKEILKRGAQKTKKSSLSEKSPEAKNRSLSEGPKNTKKEGPL